MSGNVTSEADTTDSRKEKHKWGKQLKHLILHMGNKPFSRERKNKNGKTIQIFNEESS